MPATSSQMFLHLFKQNISNLATQHKIPAYALTIITPEIDEVYANTELNTVFPIFSVSKSFAAALTAILVNKGLLNWDDPITKFNIKFKLANKKATKKLTIRHLLSHINPLPPRALDHLIEFGFTLDNLLEKLAQVPTIGEFKFSYQNILFSLIELIIEKVTNLSYEECLRQEILQPLNLTQTILNAKEYEAYEFKAKPYWKNQEVVEKLPGSNLFFATLPATGICLSIKDLNKWLKYCLLNSPGLLKPILTPLKDANPPYAMGWWQAEQSGLVMCHNGQGLGYHAHMAIVPSYKYGIAVLANMTGDEFGEKIVKQFIKATMQWDNFEIHHLFSHYYLAQPKIPTHLIIGKYYSELLENISIEETDDGKNLKITFSSNNTTGILKPFTFACYSDDPRPEVIALRNYPTFKISWSGTMQTIWKVWYYDDVVSIVQDAKEQLAKSLLFLFPNTISKPIEAQRITSQHNVKVSLKSSLDCLPNF
jgi:CubicO group peptidase (beta-lactamase class C family)